MSKLPSNIDLKAAHLPIEGASNRPSNTQQFLYLSLYFLISLGLTLYNKSVLGHTLHSTSHLVTIPFHQVIRALTPIFAIGFNLILFNHSYSGWTYLSLIPIIAGVGLATYGDYYFTTLGLLLTLLGSVLAALKTVLTNRLQTGFSTRLSALEILHHMSPLACAQSILYAYLSGEVNAIREMSAPPMGRMNYSLVLIFNAMLAFALNYVSFTANKKMGALTMTVAANVKQIFTIVLSVLFFHLKVGAANAGGIVLTLLGGAMYAKVEHEIRSVKRKVGAKESAV
ncbi:MAG: UAA transporter [Vezdaea aestivalis]|nr:MAG: UAA transporter [Vezdaea aestivalis]